MVESLSVLHDNECHAIDTCIVVCSCQSSSEAHLIYLASRAYCRRGQSGRQAQQDPAVEYPSLSGPPSGNSFHDCGAVVPSAAGIPAQPPPPPPRETQWGPSRSASNQLDPRVARPDGRGNRARTSGWGQQESLHEQAAANAWDEDEEDDGSSFHSLPASPLRHSPHGSQPNPMQAAPGVSAWGSTNRPSSARSLGPGDSSDRVSQGSGASVSGQGHSALPHGLLQPGMNGLQPSPWSGGAFGPQSADPQFDNRRLPDQLAFASDPVVGPAYMQRSGPTRSQPGFFPAAPLAAYVHQEVQGSHPQLQISAPAPVLTTSTTAAQLDDDDFLNDLLAQQQEDNKPVGIYSAPTGATLWPDLANPPPLVPGGCSPSALLSTLLAAFPLVDACVLIEVLCNCNITGSR